MEWNFLCLLQVRSQGGRSLRAPSSAALQCSTEGVKGRRPPVRSRYGRSWLQDNGPGSALEWSSPLNKSLWGRSPHALEAMHISRRMHEGRKQQKCNPAS